MATEKLITTTEVMIDGRPRHVIVEYRHTPLGGPELVAVTCAKRDVTSLLDDIALGTCKHAMHVAYGRRPFEEFVKDVSDRFRPDQKFRRPVAG